MQQSKFKYYLKKIVLLALPVAAGQVGHMMTGLADSVMVGHVGTISLAAAAFTNGIFFIPFIFGMGLVASITPLVGNAYGRGDKAKSLSLLRHGLVFATLVGIVLSGLTEIAGNYLDQMGQEPNVVAEARTYLTLLNYSLTPALVFTVIKNYLEGLGRTLPPMIVSLAMNLLNIGLNYVLIYGKLGFEPLGLEGAGIATLISRIGMMVVMLAYGLWVPSVKEYFANITQIRIRWENFAEIVKLGFPIGIQFLMEVGVFGGGTIMMGWISADAQAAHQIALQLCATTFLIASGLGTGGTIIISNLNGKKDYKEIQIAANTAFIMTLLFMAACAIMFATLREILPAFFISDPDVLVVAATLLAVAALFQLFDGFQVVVISLLRGLEDVSVPTYITFVAYWVIGMPMCYILAFSMEIGPTGIWYGYLIGLAASSLMLYLRFRYKTKQLVESLD